MPVADLSLSHGETAADPGLGRQGGEEGGGQGGQGRAAGSVLECAAAATLLHHGVGHVGGCVVVGNVVDGVHDADFISYGYVVDGIFDSSDDVVIC